MNAATITRQSKSNLALAFISLGRERKRDITVFYAFCRVIDDIADSAELSVAEKQASLAKWRQMLQAVAPGEPFADGAPSEPGGSLLASSCQLPQFAAVG